MFRSVYPRAWIGVLVALFMVFVLPACWSGALIRAQQQGTSGPSTSNSNEEREEHQEREVEARDGEHLRPDLPLPRGRTVVVRLAPIHAPETIASSVVHPRTPSVLSVRRLL